MAAVDGASNKRGMALLTFGDTHIGGAEARLTDSVESRVGALTEGIDGRLVRLHGLAAQFEAASDARLARCERMLAALMRTQCGVDARRRQERR